MAEKKPNPNATPPKKNLLIIGVILVALGGALSVYEGILRPETELEKKEREDKDKELKQEKARAAAKAANRR